MESFKLSETLDNMNRGMENIRFFGDGSGKRAGWKPA